MLFCHQQTIHVPAYTGMGDTRLQNAQFNLKLWLDIIVKVKKSAIMRTMHSVQRLEEDTKAENCNVKCLPLTCNTFSMSIYCLIELTLKCKLPFLF